MRKMYDATNVDNMPLDADFFAYYIDGKYVPTEQQLLRFAGKRTLKIAVFATTNAGDIGDGEQEDMSPTGAVQWVTMRREAGIDPTIYCDLDNWPSYKAAFGTAGVAEPHWWIAAQPGNGAELYDGTIGHQYADTGGYDISVIADYWPGVDPAPVQPAPEPTTIGDNVQRTEVALDMEVSAAGIRGWIASPCPVDQVLTAKAIVPVVDEGAWNNPPVWDSESQTAGPNSPNGTLNFSGGAPGKYAVRITYSE